MATADLPSLAAQLIRPFESIPVIDVSGLYGDADSKAQIASAIREACIHVGFFYVKNHGVDETVIASTVEAANRFYDLPLEEKMKLEFRNNHNLKGYYPPYQRGHIHESFAIRPEDDSPPSNNSTSELHLWPPEDVIPGFREVVLKYYEAVNGLGLKLFQVLALALNMPEDFFTDKVNSAAADMNIVYYPSRSEAADSREPGFGAHTDFECFTILWQGDIPALQVKNASGQWIVAQPIPGTFVVNIADQLSRWTNDIFKSTVHRVIIESGVRRISIPLFFGTNDNVMVEALPSCVSASRPARYEPILAGEHSRLRKIKAFKLSK